MSEALSPDTGECLRLWLRSLSAVAAITSTRIGITMTGSAPAIRLLNLNDAEAAPGGATTARWSVECWGTGGGAADDGTSGLLARTVRQYMPEFVGVWNGARVSGGSALRTYRQDDPTTQRPRHIVEVAFIVHP
jgi:hypothetical protein